MKYAILVVFCVASVWAVTTRTPIGDLTIPQYESLTGIFVNVATTIALIVGAWWTWDKFLRERVPFPRIETSHDVAAIRLNEEKRLVRVTLCVQNVGHVILKSDSALIRLQQITPCENVAWLSGELEEKSNGSGEAPWQMLAERVLQLGSTDIEPGEPGCYVADFIVCARVTAVAVYSHLARISHDATGV